MSTITMEQAAALVTDRLSDGGVFLCVGGKTPNTMTVGWGGVTVFWGKHVFLAPIRPQRFTHPLLEKEGAFTICVPAPGAMKRELAQAGALSGRAGDKFRAIGLETLPGRAVDAPVVRGCALYLECRVLAKTAFTAGQTDPSITEYTYRAGDFHTLFFGEIVACYTGEDA